MRPQQNNVGQSPTTLLGLIFVVLKLCGVIHWSWLWVTAPFWILLIIIFVWAVLSTLTEDKDVRGRRRR